MARNGSGTFNRLYDWTDERDAGNNIDSTKFDAEMDGMATALTDSLAKDGQTTPTANLPMGGFKHTSVATGTARSHYTRLDQTQDGLLNWAAAGGTADAITATYSPSITALTTGQICYVRAASANATTTPTFSPNGLTARTILKDDGDALAAGDIAGAGHELILRYNSSGPNWYLLNPAVQVATPYWTWVSTASASSDSFLTFTDLDADYDFHFIIDFLYTSAVGAILCQLGYGATPTWRTSGYSMVRAGGEGNVAVSAYTASNSGILLTYNTLGIGTTYAADGEVMLFNPGSTDPTRLLSKMGNVNDSGTFTVSSTWGKNGTAEANTAIRFYPGAGVFTAGTIQCYKRERQS